MPSLLFPRCLVFLCVHYIVNVDGILYVYTQQRTIKTVVRLSLTCARLKNGTRRGMPVVHTAWRFKVKTRLWWTNCSFWPMPTKDTLYNSTAALANAQATLRKYCNIKGGQGSQTWEGGIMMKPKKKSRSTVHASTTPKKTKLRNRTFTRPTPFHRPR